MVHVKKVPILPIPSGCFIGVCNSNQIFFDSRFALSFYMSQNNNTVSK